MTAIPVGTGFDIGRVIQRLFGVLGRNFVTYLLLALLLVGLPTAASSFLQLLGESPFLKPGGAGATDDFTSAAFLFLPVSWLIGAAANAVLQGAVIHGTVSDLSGTRVTFADALGTGLRNFLPLIVIGLIAAICCFFGYLIFIVPGVILGLAWSVATPAVVVERTGILGAFGRSVELTRNCRMSIFALAIIAVVVNVIIGMVAGVVVAGGALMTLAAPNQAPGAMIGVVVSQAISSLISQTVGAMIGSAGVASIYYELRYVKEGVGAQDLASVFD